MGGPVELLDVRLNEALFTRVLSLDLYGPKEAAWELDKNGWDSGIRRNRQPGAKRLPIRVEMTFVRDHPLSRGGTALVIFDNGEGVTDPSLDRFLAVGPEDLELAPFGIMDQKRIGRIAALCLLSKPKEGFWLLSATSDRGQVRLLHVTPRGLAKGKLESRFIDRGDSNMNGMKPTGSFTMIILPHVIPSIMNKEDLIEDLQWRIPRRKSDNGFTLAVDGKVVKAPELATELVVDKEGIVGYFCKDSRSRSEGIRICDATTNTVVAHAAKMPQKVPYPFGRPELSGDIFIPGLVGHQNTSRTGLSPDFLPSDDWKRIQEIMFTHFREPLARLLGDDGVIRNDSLGNVMRQMVFGFAAAWGAPDEAVPAPTGVKPTPGFDDEEEGEDEPTGKGGSNPPRRKNKPKTRKQRVIPFKYKGVTYYLTVSKQTPLERSAEFSVPNLVYVNNVDPLHEQLKSSPVALRLHVIRAVIGAIERTRDENINNPEACDIAVNTSIGLYLAAQNKKKTAE